MSTAGTGKIAPNNKHEELMDVLRLAVAGTEEMIKKRLTPPAFSRFPRELSELELSKLSQTLILLQNALVYAKHQRLEDITVAMVCESKILVSYFKLRKLRTVMTMWRFTPDVLVGLLEQCEGLGAKDEFHMYLFVRR